MIFLDANGSQLMKARDLPQQSKLAVSSSDLGNQIARILKLKISNTEVESEDRLI
jgi:hypothetical protein